MDSKKAKHVIAKVREKKGMSSIADMQTQLQKQLRSEAMRDILNTALLGAGVAGTARGGQGLWNLLTRSNKKLRTRSSVAPLPVPYRPSFKDENGEEKEAMEKFALRGSGLKYLSMKHGPQGVSLTRPISGLWGGTGNKLSEREREIFDVLQQRLAETTARKGTTGDAVSAVAEHLSGLSDRGSFSTHGYPDALEMEKDVSRHLGIPGYHKDDPIRKKEEEKEAEFFKGVYNKTFGGAGTGTEKAIGQAWAGTKNLAQRGTQGLVDGGYQGAQGALADSQAPYNAAAQYGKNYDAREAAQQNLGDKQLANTGSWWKGLGQDLISPFTAAGSYIGGAWTGGHQSGKQQASEAWNRGDQTRAAGQQGVAAAQQTYNQAKARMNGGGAAGPAPAGGANSGSSYLPKHGYDKQAFTPAMLLGGGIGAGYGAGTAPKGEVVQNMTHHGARGLGAGAGTSLGSLLGAGGGVGVANLIAKLMGTKASPRSQGIGALAGLLTGGIGGGILGNKATRALLGESPKEREGKEDEQIEVLKQRAQQARQEGEDNNGFSFRKYSADKQAIDMPKPGPTSKPGLWWYMPSMLGAGALGGYGGWKLIDHILDKRRRQEIDDEVDESRNEFQEALVSQYKRGSDSELGVALDELYNKMNKEALDLDSIVSPDTRGRALGAYATYAIPSSILGYLLVKGLADRGSRGKILEKAQRSRALKQQQSRPAELYAVPTPIDEEEE